MLALPALAALILAFASPALAAKAKEGSAKLQLRGVMLTPNWSAGPRAPNQAQQLTEIDKACELGADLVRFHISWPAAEPKGPGLYDNVYFARVDAALERARSCQIKVIADLGGSPCWVTVPAGQEPACTGWEWMAKPPAQPGQLQRFSAYLFQRYPDLFALEIWNEPNLDMFFKGTPADYVAMVAEAHAARVATGSRTKILAAALAGSDVAYLDSLYAAGLSGHDGISLHPYSFATNGQTFFSNPGRQSGRPKRMVSGYFRGVEAIRRSMVRHGEGRKGMWFTEFGFATCPATPACESEQRQAQWLGKSFRIAAEHWPFVHGLTAFIIRDLAPAEPGWEYHFGLLNHDFTPKPAFAAVRRTFKQLRKAEGQPEAKLAKGKSLRVKRAQR